MVRYCRCITVAWRGIKTSGSQGKRGRGDEDGEANSDEDSNEEEGGEAKVEYGDGNGLVTATSEHFAREDEGSRFSGETRVGATFEVDSDSLKAKTCGEDEKQNNDLSLANGIKETNMDNKKRCDGNGPVLGDFGPGGEQMLDKSTGLVRETSGTDGNKSSSPINKINMSGNVTRRSDQHNIQKNDTTDMERIDELDHNSAKNKREKREVSPSSSVGSGGDRLRKKERLGMGKCRRSIKKAKEVARKTGVEGLEENKKGVSDAYKEYYEAESESNGVFRFGNYKEGEVDSSRCNVSIEQVKEIREMIGVSWVLAKAEEKKKMKMISINVRGIGGNRKKGWIRSIIKDERPDVIGIQENKCGVVDDMWVEDIWGWQDYGFAQLPAIANSGGILLMWDMRIFTCKKAIRDERFIAVKGSWKGKDDDVFLVCIYGPHVNIKEMTKFNEFINDMRLLEVPMGGRKFTRVSDDGLKLSKLDRFLLNEKFNDLWGNLSVIALDRKLYDHCPIVIKDIDLDFGPKPFQDPKIIKEEMAKPYKNLFSDGGVTRLIFCSNKIEKISSKEAQSLEKKFNEKEVWDAICGCELMKRMGAREKWCKWVEICLRSAYVSVLVNGSPSEEFGLERGVRQGDPLSPFLFILAAEGLNAIVTEVVEKGIFRGVVVGAKNVTVSHLQYAGDTIFFGKWNKENVKALMCILKCFEEDSLFASFGDGGLNIGSLRAKNLALLVVGWAMVGIWEGGSGGRVWNDIVRIGEEIDGVGINFSSSCVRVLGDGKDIRFWVDMWVYNWRLCDRFPRLYHLDRRKEGSVWDKGSWVNNMWCWKWEWVRSIMGRVTRDLDELVGVLQNVVVHSNCRDNWRWLLGEDGEFTVKELARLVEEKTLHVENGGHETFWNRLVPKKVNIFAWRAIKGRLPVRVELDRRGIDLDSVLCPCCNNIVETCAHCLVTCDLAMSVWVKVFSWWRVGSVNAFTINELFSSNGTVNVPISLSRVWQAVI
ncbi:reverse transcriptase domain, reverse transcriptase zinc-binding domain protein [Tanacetum coccineum]